MSDELPFTIQSASWRDLHELILLEKECFGQDAWPMLDLLGVLTFPNVVRLKAEWEGKMVGFVGGEAHYLEERDVGWIITLGVFKEHRRKGIATALLQACERELATPRIRLCVRVSNEEAIQLYKKAGYVQVEVWPQYYREGENALVFEKQTL